MSVRALACAFGALFALGCGIELEGGASVDAGSGAAGGGGGVLGGFGGDGASGGAAGASGGAAGAPTTTCASGFQCLPKAPDQWGYAFLALGAYAAALPPGPQCPDGAEPQAFFSEPAGAGTCQPCACGPIQGGACSVPLLCGFNSSCASLQDFTQGDGNCNYQSGSPTLSCMLGGPTVQTPGTCAPSGGGPAPMDPWKKRADFCPAKSAGSCGSSSECVPLGADVYAGTACVYLPGDHPCPSDWPTRSMLHQKPLDERQCSACSCAPGPVTCLAEYEFYDDGVCGGGGKKVASTTCSDVSDKINDFWPAWGYRRTKAPVLGGTCVPTGGVPSGTVSGDPNSALTLCCRPAG